jgi:cysteine desulfurase
MSAVIMTPNALDSPVNTFCPMHIFLDHNSTTPLLDEVAERMTECYQRAYGNPASQHAAGRQARRVVEDARESIAEILGARMRGRHADRLIFTSGGTEANNLAILGLAAVKRGMLMVSAIEHPSVSGPAELLRSRGWRVESFPVDATGVVSVDQLRQWAGAEKDACVTAAVMLGNNETGVLQPVTELAIICNEHGIPLHTDAVQVVGKLPVNFAQLGVATLAFSAHKFHGPRGIGGLLVRGDVELQPVLYGGFQQSGLRPGTEPVALIAGMHKALEIWQRDQKERQLRIAALRDRFESGLLARVSGAIINGSAANRLPHTSNVSFPGLDRRALAMALDLEGVACSTGSACASGSSEPSPVLIAMGLSAEVVAGSLRFSLGAGTTETEIDAAIERIVRIVERMAERHQRTTLY